MPQCPCGRLGLLKKPVALADCCGPFVDDFAQTPAPDSEALMRSRYTAFVLERAEYLLATWHSSRRPSAIEFDPGVKWLGLDLRAHHMLDATHAEVEFVARQKSKGRPAMRLQERSRFVREQARWYYVDGDVI